MMNYVWTIMIGAAFLGAVFCGRTQELSAAVLSGAAGAVSLAIKILGSMCLWNGLMRVAGESGLTKRIEKLLFPLVKRLFPKYSKTPAGSAISANITANLLGLGNAATPLGINAMRKMKEINGKDEADNEMIRFAVLNSAALTLMPTTVAVLRAAAGSKNPMSVMLAVWVSGIAALAAGLLTEKILSKR